MHHINQIDVIICFAQLKMSFTSLVYCNHSQLSAVSPENAPDEMDVIMLCEMYLRTESDCYHSGDDC